jgi:hypothetical protein
MGVQHAILSYANARIVRTSLCVLYPPGTRSDLPLSLSLLHVCLFNVWVWVGMYASHILYSNIVFSTNLYTGGILTKDLNLSCLFFPEGLQREYCSAVLVPQRDTINRRANAWNCVISKQRVLTEYSTLLIQLCIPNVYQVLSNRLLFFAALYSLPVFEFIYCIKEPCRSSPSYFGGPVSDSLSRDQVFWGLSLPSPLPVLRRPRVDLY